MSMRVIAPVVVGLLGIAVVGGLYFASRARDAAGGEPPSEVLLVTGFGPFGTFDTNPSWEAVRVLDGMTFGRCVVRTAKLDVVYANAADQLREAIRQAKPDRVLCLGVAAGDHLRLEVTARNRDTSTFPDNAGEVRANVPIRPDGPALLPSRLRVKTLLERLTQEGYEVRLSEDAGGYLCNHVFYRLVDDLPDDRVAGFVHVPSLGKAWDLERLRAAVRLVVEITAEEK